MSVVSLIEIFQVCKKKHMYKYLKAKEQAQEYLLLMRQSIKYQLLTRQDTGPNEILVTLKLPDSKKILIFFCFIIDGSILVCQRMNS